MWWVSGKGNWGDCIQFPGGHIWSTSWLVMGENSTHGQVLTRDRDTLRWPVFPARSAMLMGIQRHAVVSSPPSWACLPTVSATLLLSVRGHTLRPQSYLEALCQVLQIQPPRWLYTPISCDPERPFRDSHTSWFPSLQNPSLGWL